MGVEDNKLQTGVAHIRPGEGRRSLWVMGEKVTCKITSDQPSGAYSLFEITTQPGDGPSPHVQHWEDESLYVLEGEYEFVDEGRSTIKAGVGSLIYIPKGNLHTHKNVGEGPGRMLVSQTPGARTSASSRKSASPRPARLCLQRRRDRRRSLRDSPR